MYGKIKNKYYYGQETKSFELPCLDHRKSFYGKANVFEFDDGVKILVSYSTPVAAIDENGVFLRLWDGESMTTTRHINSFLRFYGLTGGGVAWWRNQPVSA
jgi:hypothetical protein